MQKFITLSLVLFLAFFGYYRINSRLNTGAPPNGIPESEIPDLNRRGWIESWERPDMPTTVALQVGHKDNDNFPEELAKLRDNNGTSGGGKSEVEVNEMIALETKKLLEEKGIVVDILPATVPPDYFADAFVAIHADGSTDRRVNGYKIAPPWRDFSGDAKRLVDLMTKTYQEETSMPWDDNITRNMRGYYAFSWWRYEHAIHPMTTAVIVETGFLTNPSDASFLINSPEISAKGIARGIIMYLEEEGLI